MDRGTAQLVSPCISHLKPSRMPTTLTLLTRARIVAARITLLMPGAGPPPQRMATRCESGMRNGMPSRGPSGLFRPPEALPVQPGQEFFNLHNHDFARVAVAVPRLQVADPAFNAAQTIELMEQAAARRAGLVLF